MSIYVGSKNTKCLIETPKNINLELNPLNVNVTGTFGAIAGGVAKGFSASNYLTLPEVFNPESNSWEMVFKVKTGTIGAYQYFIGANTSNRISVGLNNSNKMLVNIGSGSWTVMTGTSTLQADTEYTFKVVYDGANYMGYVNDNLEFTVASSITLNTVLRLGNDVTKTSEFWKGSIDLSQSYININGERWWQGGTGTLKLKKDSKIYIPNGWSDYDYYKCVCQDWTQPILTENGVVGEDSFAVACEKQYNANVPAWKAFNGTIVADTNNDRWQINSVTLGTYYWIGWYNPTELKINTLQVYNGQNSYHCGAWYIAASNDNSTWITLKSGTNKNTGANTAWNPINLNMTKGYKYFRLYVQPTATNSMQIGEIQITAQEVIGVVEGTPDDYDYKSGKGERVFKETIIQEDVVIDRYDNAQQFYFYNPNDAAKTLNVYSGELPKTPVENGVWYDTENNVIKKYYLENWGEDNYSLPYCIATTNSYGHTSIDETFDWCGYCGRTVFVLPGVKGFIANGITDTGAYNSTDFTTNKVLIADLDDAVTERDLLLSDDYVGFVDCIYNKTKNFLYNADEDIVKAIQFGKINSDATQITSLTTYTLQPITTVIKIEDIAEHGVYVGSKNTNCLTYTPKHVDVELDPLNVSVTGTWGAIADGVAKGFTTANYLTVPNAFDVTDGSSWEMVYKVRTGTGVSSAQYIFSGLTSRSCTVYIQSSRFGIGLSSASGSWNITDGTKGTYVVLPETDYWLKFSFNGSSYTLSYSLDGVDYINDITKETTSSVYGGVTLGLGVSRTVSESFTGIIYLSQSYININGERWWSGDSYTKVGSWVENGVVGSFTSANYVTLPEVLPSSITSSEYVFKITTGASVTSSTSQTISSHKSPNTGVVSIISSRFAFYGSSWVKGVTTVEPNTEYFLKTVFDGSSWTLYSSIDNIDWTQEVTWSTTTSYAGTNLYIGRDYDTTGEYFTGTIDLTQSYIKINNEIWWQGGTGDVTLKQGSKVFVPNGWSDYDYYKYVYQDWTQPVLTENGVLGGDSFACDQSTVRGNYYAYQAFDNMGSTTMWHSTNSIPAWISWYNPTPLKITNVNVTNRSSDGSYPKAYQLQYSDDNSTWTTTVSGNGTGGDSVSWDIPVTLDTYHKYWRLYVISASGSNSGYVSIGEIVITAQERLTVVGTESDYDVKIPKGYKVFNELVIPNDISAQSFANSEQVVCYNPETNRLCFVNNDVYDTDNNVMSDNISFPVAICTANTTSVTSIDEVFDWCGRIGNTAFVLPNVKGFIAKGYKDTGTYNSTEFTVNKVLTADIDTVTDRSLLLSADKLDYVECNYNKKDNLLYNTDGEVINAVECGKVTSDGTAITSLTPYTAQPLTTTINIKAIYSGSQLVYLYQPYEPETVILYGANTGTKTYILDNGVYQCCVVGGGIQGNYWSKAGGAAVEIQFRLTEKATVVVYSGGGSSTGYIDIDGVRIAQAGGARGQNSGGVYSIDTASPYYVSTIVARNGGGANLSTAGSVSPYGGWGAGGQNGGARLAYVSA